MGKYISAILVFALVLPAAAVALPFNSDMVDVQKSTGKIVRERAPGTVPLGTLGSYLPNKDEASKLQSPNPGDALSISNGRRLFTVNCFPCHGDIGRKDWSMGPVGLKGMPAPDLGLRKDLTDGKIFATIHFGGLAIMPPLGWKLSPAEHWDIVNYVKKVQETR